MVEVAINLGNKSDLSHAGRVQVFLTKLGVEPTTQVVSALRTPHRRDRIIKEPQSRRIVVRAGMSIALGGVIAARRYGP